MSHGIRFSDEPTNSPLARAFRAGRLDAPPASSREALVAALGAGTAGGLLTGAGAAVGAPSAPKAAGLAAALKAWVSPLVVISIVAAAPVPRPERARAPMTAVEAPPPLRDPSPLPTRPPLSMPAPVPTSVQSVARVAPESRPLPRAPLRAPSLPSAPPVPPVAVAPLASAVVAASPPTPDPAPLTAPSSLRAELDALDAARDLLRRGDARGAEIALARYDARFPHGALAPEAAFLRIRALAEAHDDEGVARRSRAFLDAYPKSPLGARVRSLAERPARPR